MNMKHTPTPWIVVTGDVIRNTEGERVADCDTTEIDTRPCPPIEKDKANAAFIVRACNSYDGLVEALEGALSYLYDNSHSERRRGENVASILDALAKAKGE